MPLLIAHQLPLLAPRVQRAWQWRPSLSVESLAVIAGFFFTLFCNGPFWAAYAQAFGGQSARGWLLGASLALLITCLHSLLLCLVLMRWNAKWVLTVLLGVTAFAVYYMDAYVVFIDPDMVRNVLHTERKEALELLTPGLWPAMLLYALVPAVLLWRVRIPRLTLGRAAMRRVAMVAALLAVTVCVGLLSFQDLSALMRSNKSLRYLVTPGNVVTSLARVVDGAASDAALPRQRIAEDAVAAALPGTRPTLLVIIVGETVRAQNWGLSGYARDTTPQLSRLGVINFADVTACGSSTEVSLPCLFSARGRRDYDEDAIRRSESLLHVLQRAGIQTAWRDNQTGCKGVCEGLPFQSFRDAATPEWCHGGLCFDEVLLEGLQEHIDAVPGSQVVVLHPLGNHGPSYASRYPEAFRRFRPTCDTPQLGDCSEEEIVNAYDNAVLYADHVVAQTIRFLQRQQGRDTALIYVSDHGESLGETGLFLHGVPYAIAPDVQIKVPMVAWLSPSLVAARGLSRSCLEQVARQPASHDNLFSSVLGLMQVDTEARDPALDVFSACTDAA